MAKNELEQMKLNLFKAAMKLHVLRLEWPIASTNVSSSVSTQTIYFCTKDVLKTMEPTSSTGFNTFLPHNCSQHSLQPKLA